MVKHGALSKSHVYHLLRSKDARVRRAAFTLLETSNPRLRTNSEVFAEVIRFIWNANPSYDVYHEFTERQFQFNYKVHELISARLKIERQYKQNAEPSDLTDDAPHYEAGLFGRLFRRIARFLLSPQQRRLRTLAAVSSSRGRTSDNPAGTTTAGRIM
jgi:hypothetical protein